MHQDKCCNLRDDNMSMLLQLTGLRLNVLCDVITCLLSQCSYFWSAGQPNRLSLCCWLCCLPLSLCDVQSGKELVLGGIKPPKAKEWDQDKTYMQRPVGEQFRPPPPKGPQTKQGAGRQ